MIKVALRNRTRKYPKINYDLFCKFAIRAIEFADFNINDCWEFSVEFVSDKKMAQINRDFVGHIGTTDVITFSYLDDIESVFEDDTALELIICLDVAFRQGNIIENSSYASELALYVVHGILHAAKYDDLTDEARPIMREKEKELISKLKNEFNFEDIFGSVCQ